MYAYADKHDTIQEAFGKEIRRALLILLAPFVPHITEELWQMLGETEKSVHEAAWLTVDESALEVETIELAVQVNGKVRGVVTIAAEAAEDEIAAAAKALPEVKKYTDGKTIAKCIVVKGRIVNIVVK